MQNDDGTQSLTDVLSHTSEVLAGSQKCALIPNRSHLRHAETSLHGDLPGDGLGLTQTVKHLLKDITPALSAASLSPNYYGFVTGGTTPAAHAADILVSLYDQNPLVHLPDQTIATTVENHALSLLMQLLRFDRSQWSGVFSTGATASNVLGLALAREYTVNEAIKRRGGSENVASIGLLQACDAAGIESIDVYSTMPHSSLLKAASIVGIGRSHVHDVSQGEEDLHFDMGKLADCLSRKGQKAASIIVISAGEVNSGLFATKDFEDVQSIRDLCDKHNAWLHVDGAFGIFARILPRNAATEYVIQGAEGLELADSIAGDGHKMLNVPYDCGFFLTRHASLSQEVFQNSNASYLTAGGHGIVSPLNISIENSRRFRGLPVYTNLVAYGLHGYRDMLWRQMSLAREIAKYLFHHDAFQLLPDCLYRSDDDIERNVFMIVLFRAKDEVLNKELPTRINQTSRLYVSGTRWNSEDACRFAVANWQVKPKEDSELVQDVLDNIVNDWTTLH